MEMESLRFMARSESSDRVGRHTDSRRNLRKEPTIRPSELKRVVGFTVDRISLFVDRSVVPTTQQREVRQRGGPAFGPVSHVMPLAQRRAAPREAAAAVPMIHH